MGLMKKSVALKLRLRDSAHYKVVGFYIYGKNNRRRRLADLPIYYFETEEDWRILPVMSENRLLEYCKSNAVKTFYCSYYQ